MAKPDGGPAFPVPLTYVENDEGYKERVTADDCGFGGMSVRDYFAAQALAGWLASFDGDVRHPASRQDSETDTDITSRCRNLAVMSYALADALIAERERD